MVGLFLHTRDTTECDALRGNLTATREAHVVGMCDQIPECE